MPKANDRIGPYQLIRKLGKGAFGEVWLAQNITALAAREVALKIPLDDDLDLDAIRQEADIWIAASGHTNVLPIIEASVYGEHVVIASEYAPDGSLEEWLKRHGGRAPSVEAAVEMARGILAGLEYLHTRKIIHRDLKPANILLQGETPRIADFGISRMLRSNSYSVVMAGTPVYMAPEAFQRKRNEQTDLWSVGVLLYQLLSGQLPFLGHDLVELMGAIRDEEQEPLPITVPVWLQEIVARSLQKDAVVRYRTAAELRAALTYPKLDIAPPPVTKLQSSPQTFCLTPMTEISTPIVDTAAPYHKRLIAMNAQAVSPAPRWSWLLALVFVGLQAVMGIGYWLWQKPVKERELPEKGQLRPATGPEFTEPINGANLTMIRVTGGLFKMGSPDGQGNIAEYPQHPVTLSDFYIGQHEVTQALWQAVMDNNPSQFKGDLNRPVEQVSWEDATRFCRRLSQHTGKAYRLPSEAEWEYACRAGDYADDLNAIAWFADNAEKNTHPVGKKLPNRFRLYDLHGNVWEWCQDGWHENYKGAPTDGSTWPSGGESNSLVLYIVLRGGAWSAKSIHCRSATRIGFPSNKGDSDIGFRVALDAKTP